MVWTDTHSHITDDAFAGDEEAVLDRALQADVTRLVVVGCRREDFTTVLKLARTRRGIVCALGLHPDRAGDPFDEDLAHLAEHLTDPLVRALGEVGLDYHWTPETKRAQRRLLEIQAEMAEMRGLPLVIHEREAWKDLTALLSGLKTKILLHSFAHSTAELETAMRAGWYVAFGGIATFRSAADTREAARVSPEEKILLETDAPYLSPHPFRGERNEPARVAVIGTYLAGIRETTPEEFAWRTTRNAENFFGPWQTQQKPESRARKG